jgi:hypothetical protein
MQSSRKIILQALAPKYLLAKITKAHIPLIDKYGKSSKCNPIKKLALESLCIRVGALRILLYGL